MNSLNKNESDLPRPSPFKGPPSTTSHTPPHNDPSSPNYVTSGSSSIKSFERGTRQNTIPITEWYPTENTHTMYRSAVPEPLAPRRSREDLSRTPDFGTMHATGYPVDEQRSMVHDQNVGTPSPYEYNPANGAVYAEEANIYPYQSSNVRPSGEAALQQDVYIVSPLDLSAAYRPHDNESDVSSLRLSLPYISSEHRMPHVERPTPAPPELPDTSQNGSFGGFNRNHIVRNTLVEAMPRRSNSDREDHQQSRRCQKRKPILVGGTVLVLLALLVIATVLIFPIWGPARQEHDGVGTSTASSSDLTGSVSSTHSTDGMQRNTTTHTMGMHNSTITRGPGGMNDSTATHTVGGIHSSIKTHASSETRGSTKTHTTEEVHSSRTIRMKNEVHGSTKTHATSKTHSSSSSVVTKDSVTHQSKRSATTSAAVTT